MILIGELALLWSLQTAWCLYYALRYRWRATPLGPVWLAKGSLLALLWPLLAVNEVVHVPGWVWTVCIGPALIAATGAWLLVTILVDRRRRALRPGGPTPSARRT